jgi:coenzyme F420-reducing hydrogenase beta subunit
VTAAPLPKPPSAPQQEPIDYQILLLSLAEEYINAAHSLGSTVALLKKEADVEQYHKLIVTGLGCLEVVLKRFRLPPRVEASLTVRYVALLCEETENYSEMESLLTKGIALCDRVRLSVNALGSSSNLCRTECSI